MFGRFFFNGVIDRVDQWAGELFAAGQPMSEILVADYITLKYFSEWWNIIQNAWTNEADRLKAES